jgi:hypothetical protein
VVICDDETFEILSAVNIKIMVIWNVGPCTLVYVYKTTRHHIPEDHNRNR